MTDLRCPDCKAKVAEYVEIDGRRYTIDNVPPWFENITPAIGHSKTQDTAAENAVSNRRGADIGNVVLWVIVGLIVLSLSIGAAKIWG